VRRFTQDNIDSVRVIECLKSAGMLIKEIQVFMQKVEQGDATLQDRLGMFLRLKKQVQQQMRELQNTLEMIDFKCNYYGKAVKDGTEKYVKEEMPLSSLILPNVKMSRNANPAEVNPQSWTKQVQVWRFLFCLNFLMSRN
jgi:hypothetical protein